MFNKLTNLKLLNPRKLYGDSVTRTFWLNVAVQYGTIKMIEYMLTLVGNAPTSSDTFYAHNFDCSDMSTLIKFYLSKRHCRRMCSGKHNDTVQVMRLCYDYFAPVRRHMWASDIAQLCITDYSSLFREVLECFKEELNDWQETMMIYALNHAKYDVVGYMVYNWTLDYRRLEGVLSTHARYGYDKTNKALDATIKYIVKKYSHLRNAKRAAEQITPDTEQAITEITIDNFLSVVNNERRRLGIQPYQSRT